jgi:simple sugar transport system permease protein
MSDVSLIAESAARLASLLLFVALGELLAERAGTLNISIEGMMLAGAFSGAYVASETGSPVVGILAGLSAGWLVSLIQAEFSHRLTANQFVVGIAINILVLGVTSFVNASIKLTSVKVSVVTIPVLVHLPGIGKALFEQPWPFFLIYPLMPFTWWLLHRTRWGLELRACGENPGSAAATGIDVRRRRRQVIQVCGLYSGLGGAFLSVALLGTFTSDMTAGRGFVAIAAVIIGSWTVGGTIIGALIFGSADALRLALPAIGVQLEPQLLIAAPYLIALVTILVFARGRRQPRALGQDYGMATA